MPLSNRSTSSTSPGFGGGTLEWNHTVEAGADRCLWICATSDQAITGVTVDGVAATLVEEQPYFFDIQAPVYRFLDPPTGSVPIVVTFAATAFSRAGAALSMSGVDQATPEANEVLVNSDVGGGNFGGSVSRSVTPTDGETYSFLGMRTAGDDTLATVGGDASLLEEADDSGGDELNLYIARATADPATHLYTFVADSNHAFFGFSPVAAEEGGDPPGEPEISAQATSWDAIEIELGALPAGADEVEIWGSADPGVDETDTLVATLTAAGVTYWTGLDPSSRSEPGGEITPTTYYLRPRAVNTEGETWGDEVSAATWTDDAIATGTDGAIAEIPYEVPSGVTAEAYRVRVGDLRRAASAIGVSRSLQVVVRDSAETVLIDETLTGEDLATAQDGTEHVLPLSPPVEGPETLTATWTASIDP